MGGYGSGRPRTKTAGTTDQLLSFDIHDLLRPGVRPVSHDDLALAARDCPGIHWAVGGTRVRVALLLAPGAWRGRRFGPRGRPRPVFLVSLGWLRPTLFPVSDVQPVDREALPGRHDQVAIRAVPDFFRNPVAMLTSQRHGEVE
jgi:hypothetical protein